MKASAEKAIKNPWLVLRCNTQSRVADGELHLLSRHEAETDTAPLFVVGNGVLDQIQKSHAKQRTVTPHFDPRLDFPPELDFGIGCQDLRIFDNGFELLAQRYE